MKFWKKFPLPKISKRKKFVISSFLLSVGLLGAEFIVDVSRFYQAIILLGLFCFFLSIWSLFGGIEGIEWFTVLIFPLIFTLSIGFFSLLLDNWEKKILLGIFLGVGSYIIFLVENIFSVAALKTIQLLRSAQAVNFLFTLIASFFIYEVVFSFRLPFWANFLIVYLTSFPIILQSLWSVNLERKIVPKLWLYTFVLSFTQGETAVALSFWPLSIPSISLALVTVLYITLGLSQQSLAFRLFSNTINEYLLIGIVVFLVIFFTTYWSGWR